MPDELPDDPERWPRDPYELLGVRHTATETDLKRAYTRLIRRFKPERFPDQFRRVREAYEAALDALKWRSRFDLSDDPDPPAEPLRPPAPEADVPEAYTADAADPRAHRPGDPVDEAWALAARGELHAAYSRLVELATVRADAPAVPLRLYWLLALRPALDATRTRHLWLAAALDRARLTGAAADLYQRELEADPDAALFGPYARLLDAGAAPGPLLRAARMRLAAAGAARALVRVEVNLDALAPRADQFDETAWLGYLVGVMGVVGFERGHPARVKCADLIAGLKHLQLRVAWAFDQLDEQDAVFNAWWRAHAAPDPVRDVVRDAWAGPPAGWRRAAHRAAAWVRSDPDAALRQLDAAAAVSDARPLLDTFGQLLAAHARFDRSHSPGVVRGLVRQFLATARARDYRSVRSELLQLLLCEFVDPAELVHACSVDTDRPAREFAREVRGDAALRLVWLTATVDC
ncbi:DnaJ domain-containing protein [Gemmata sp.]|uniref:J domain-containing protein n=1 Tax=Gemmata sp. TaxID=1914242 RepID=UPI003F720BFA